MTAPFTQPPIRSYRLRSPDLWAVIRAAWEGGESASALARRHDVPVSTVIGRSNRERWARRPQTPVPASAEVRPLTGALEIAEAALAVASEALQRGRAAEAMALIKAGDAVGAFADFVCKLRLMEGQPAAAATQDPPQAPAAIWPPTCADPAAAL